MVGMQSMGSLPALAALLPSSHNLDEKRDI